MSKAEGAKAGYDGEGIPITRTGPWSPVAGSNPGEAWGSRGVGISRTASKDGGEKPGSTKTVDSARAVDISKGGW